MSLAVCSAAVARLRAAANHVRIVNCRKTGQKTPRMHVKAAVDCRVTSAHAVIMLLWLLLIPTSSAIICRNTRHDTRTNTTDELLNCDGDSCFTFVDRHLLTQVHSRKLLCNVAMSYRDAQEVLTPHNNYWRMAIPAFIVTTGFCVCATVPTTATTCKISSLKVVSSNYYSSSL